jgi:dual specificity MAP kinase phosphatase
MTALVAQPALPGRSRTPPPLPAALAVKASNIAPIPNRHIPYCSPGPAPASLGRAPVTPPASPPSRKLGAPTISLLHPPALYPKISVEPPVYSIDATGLSKAIGHIATSPLPETGHVFPWLHGLHPDNQVQLTFFLARRRPLCKIPRCLRGITIVKADGDLSRARLKGAIAPSEILAPGGLEDATFYDADPKEGFSVRNFHIQAAKVATVSDIVVYGDDETEDAELHEVARRFSIAQKRYKQQCQAAGVSLADYSTFLLSGKMFPPNPPEVSAM